jgi:2-phospho-L-lactate guanylyltransferase
VRTTAILPVKDFAAANQRLAGTGLSAAAGLSPADRESLAEAMFRDVLSAVTRSSLIDDVVVVSRGATPRRIAGEHGVGLVADGERGHNAAAQVGIEAAISAGAERVLLVPGDCPALDPSDLNRLLSRPTVTPSVLIVPDRHGTGTNALVLTPPDALAPSFGPGSCERHVRTAQAGGVSVEVVLVPSLATDVDTPEDLDALEASLASAEPAAAPATRRALIRLTVASK